MATKMQFNVRMSADVVAAAKLAAGAERISLNEYIERLVKADTDVKQAASLEAAGEFLDEFGDLIDAEEARRARS